MSDASPVDDNNNDGTSACRVTRFSNWCDPSKSALHPNNSPNKDSRSVDAPKERANSYSSLQASGNHLTTSAEPVEDDAKCEHRIIAQKLFYRQHQTSLKDSDESSSEKENNQLNGDLAKEAKSSPIKICHHKACPRGILKYPPGWRRRAVSESSAMICSTSSNSDDNSYFGTSLDSPDVLFEFDDDCIDDEDQDKPKKNVTFSDKMATFVFRPNSSILGRRLKNQKKAKKKKEKKLRDSLESFPCENDANYVEFKDDIEATKHFIAMQRLPLDSFDSNSDVSSSSGCDCSASDCSGDEAPSEVLNKYEDESKADSSKSKRKNRRNRNRRNKQTVRTHLEIGGYDSD